jgi:hypothetical protein
MPVLVQQPKVIRDVFVHDINGKIHPILIVPGIPGVEYPITEAHTDTCFVFIQSGFPSGESRVVFPRSSVIRIDYKYKP